jgi:hypothetical protein
MATHPQPTSIKNYTVDYFYEIKNFIRDQLGDINYFSDDVKLFFEKMTQNNLPYLRKKKPYQQPQLTDEDWRKRKTVHSIKKENQDQNEKTYQELKGFLNKISSTNYSTILDEINKTLNNYDEFEDYEHYLDLLLNDIIKKARLEPTYCLYYVKIINGLEDKENINNFITKLKDEYFTTLKNLKITESQLQLQSQNNDEVVEEENTESYDEFCNSRKHKNSQKGYSQFIGELFNSHKITIGEVINYWNTIINNLNGLVNCHTNNTNQQSQKNCVRLIEENILYLFPLVEITIEIIMKINLHSHQTEKIQNIFKNIETLSENKIIPNKSRFMLIDIMDLYQSHKEKQKQKPKHNFKERNERNEKDKFKPSSKYNGSGSGSGNWTDNKNQNQNQNQNHNNNHNNRHMSRNGNGNGGNGGNGMSANGNRKP